MSTALADTTLQAQNVALALSHGTLECRDLAMSQRFYSEFLGLETVRRGTVAVWFRCGGAWMVVSVCTGTKQTALPIESRWCLDMGSRAEVDAAHEAATRLQETYGITEILPLETQAGQYSFCLRDLDGNWWEICHRPERFYESVFGTTGS